MSGLVLCWSCGRALPRVEGGRTITQCCGERDGPANPASALSDAVLALAATALDPGATVRAQPSGETSPLRSELAATEAAAPRGPSPFGSSRLALPPVLVRFPGASGPRDLDLEVKELLAEGGMGRVYLAEQRSLAREVAIKTVKDASETALADALVWEGAITGYLDHPGVTPVHLLGAGPDGAPLLVMKRLVGVRWTDLLALEDPSARVPTLPKHRLRAHVEILMEVARTLHHAHRRGVVHLDVKPDDVMIGELGEIVLVDWGVATTLERAAEPGRAFSGTPSFVAPEVVRGEPVGPWTDVYLAGAALHVALTGRPRHEGETLRAVLEAAAASAPFAYDAGLPADLAALANAATHRDPSARPRDALAFRALLAEHLDHDTSLALTRDGLARLAELGDRVEGAAFDAAAMRLVTEARFAFQTALGRWAENDEARRGLSRARAATAEIEVLRENLAGAREAAAELDAVPEEVRARIDALAELLARRAASDVELRQVHADLDLDRGARARNLTFGAISVLVLVHTVFGGGLQPIDPAALASMPMAAYLAIPMLAVVAVGVGAAIFGRRMLSNAMGRRLLGTFVTAAIALTLHRAALLTFGARGVFMVSTDLIVLAAALSGVALFVTARAWVAVACSCSGALAMTLWPAYPTLVFNATGALTVAGLVWALGRRRRAPAS